MQIYQIVLHKDVGQRTLTGGSDELIGLQIIRSSTEQDLSLQSRQRSRVGSWGEQLN